MRYAVNSCGVLPISADGATRYFATSLTPHDSMFHVACSHSLAVCDVLFRGPTLDESPGESSPGGLPARVLIRAELHGAGCRLQHGVYLTRVRGSLYVSVQILSGIDTPGLQSDPPDPKLYVGAQTRSSVWLLTRKKQSHRADQASRKRGGS